jgi:hypothetical protein
MNDWNLDISLKKARQNEELISLGDSQILRFIRDIKNINYTEKEIYEVKKQIKQLKKNKDTAKNRKEIKELYDKLDKMLFIEDYITIVFDKKSDFDKMCSRKGFYINGKKFKRIIGTTGGVKQNSVNFCSEEIYSELNKRLENGRNKDIEMIPAKYEAYKALSASVSTPVTQTDRILVIKDGTTHIKDKVIKVYDDGNGGFKVDKNVDYESDKDFAVGSCMIRKELAEQWAIDLGLTKIIEGGKVVADFIPSGFNTRFSCEKGMVYTFPFEEFGEKIAKSYIVKDVWGHEKDIRNIDLILTTNMVKLWNAYESIEDYLDNCKKNGYLLSVTKVCPKQLEEKRNMNYQYLQSYELNDKDIEELVQETVTNIKGALGDDYIKSILFTKGIHITDKNINESDYDYIRALMIDKRMVSDPYVKNKIYRMIEKKIKEAKKGVLQVDGNYSIVSGDLYALCESMFGMEVKGLLKYNEFYSRTWLDKGVNEIVAFRSPMTSHNNIKKMKLVDSDEVKHWYRYMKTVTILNAWDTTTDAMNGMDFDSDAIITTNNPVILRNTRNELPIICEQKSAKKVKVTESLLKKSNKNGFSKFFVI